MSPSHVRLSNLTAALTAGLVACIVNQMVHNNPRPLDGVFAALGEPTRRAMIERLAISDATVAELAQPFAMSLQAIIKHVRVLEEAGLVCRTRVGRTNHVALVPEALQAAAAWLNARTPAPATPLPLGVPPARGADLLTRARALHEALAPRLALVRSALSDVSPEGAGFEPAEAVVRALRAARAHHAAMNEALRLFDALTRRLADDAAEEDLDGLRALIMPLARLMYDLRPLLPTERAAA